MRKKYLCDKCGLSFHRHYFQGNNSYCLKCFQVVKGLHRMPSSVPIQASLDKIRTVNDSGNVYCGSALIGKKVKLVLVEDHDTEKV